MDEEGSQNNRRLLHIAASACRATYDVDARHVSRVLCNDEDVACLVASSIMVHETATKDPSASQENVQDARISHALEDCLRKMVLDCPTGMNAAVTGLLTGAVIKAPWGICSTNSSWMASSTERTVFQEPWTLHYHILSGELLVDGRPPGRIPEIFEQDEIFARVFEARVLRVFSSDMPGMTYTVSQPINGHRVHLAMRQEKLVIRAQIEDKIFEVVPHEVFRADLPRHFVEDYVHWLDLKSSEVEFRPLGSRWITSEKNWRLRFSSHGQTFLQHPNERLANPLGRVAQQISGLLASLDDRVNIHVILTDDGVIEVTLPRFALHFFVNKDGFLESKEYGAVVASEQTIGCL